MRTITENSSKEDVVQAAAERFLYNTTSIERLSKIEESELREAINRFDNQKAFIIGKMQYIVCPNGLDEKRKTVRCYKTGYDIRTFPLSIGRISFVEYVKVEKVFSRNKMAYMVLENIDACLEFPYNNISYARGKLRRANEKDYPYFVAVCEGKILSY